MANTQRVKNASLAASDRVFVVAFTISVTVHLVILIGRVLQLPWFTRMRENLPLEVVYEALTQPEAQLFQAQLERARRDAVVAPTPSQIGERIQIRVPDRPLLVVERSLEESMPVRDAIIDLTDLVNASRGDPVLLSYFGAIREKIQATANRQEWPMPEKGGGLVYTSFVLSAEGNIRNVSIVADRSVAQRELHHISLRIVAAAGPFPPFPPSMKEAEKTIVVPLEFISEP